jgi:DNA-binding CsgD family transcriptional regulator
MRLKAQEGEEWIHTMNMAVLNRAPSACAQPFDVEKDDLREALGDIGRRLYRSRTLREAEAALDEVKLLLGVPWAVWNADTAPPSSCPEAVAYCERSGWSPEIMELWKDRHVPLKTQFYIRCRFEHLPFVTVFDRKPKRRISSKYSQIDELLRIMGISTMLTVPIHLPKGQIAMLTWAGELKKEALEALLPEISGELLAIGHYFMRIYRDQLGYSWAASEELSRLTPREWDCLRTLAQGYREAEVANLLGILKSTVRFHLHNVVRKFGCKNRTQAVALAAQLGVLGPIGP